MAHPNATNVSGPHIVMYHYFIHFQRVKANAHTTPVRMTVATRAIMTTVAEDVAEAATMKVTVAVAVVVVVAGTMTEDTAGAVTLTVVDTVEDATMTAEAVTMTGGTKYRICAWKEVSTSFLR
jgi:hypothetical protein